MRQHKLESIKTEIQGNTASCHTFEGKPNKTMHWELMSLLVNSALETNGASEALS